jgi:hypothetical protein
VCSSVILALFIFAVSPDMWMLIKLIIEEGNILINL